jgi:hypothetical protein
VWPGRLPEFLYVKYPGNVNYSKSRLEFPSAKSDEVVLALREAYFSQTKRPSLEAKSAIKRKSRENGLGNFSSYTKQTWFLSAGSPSRENLLVNFWTMVSITWSDLRTLYRGKTQFCGPSSFRIYRLPLRDIVSIYDILCMQRDLANGEEELVEGSPYLEVPVIHQI